MATPFDRRQFLKFGLLTGSVAGMGGCASLDRIFMGDSANLSQEVVILGGGMAGLVAAYELKKNKIPFRLFEASSRLGGRVRTVRTGGEGSPWVDLGAEFFTAGHLQVLALAKELNVQYEEVKTPTGLHPHFFFLRGRVVALKDLAKAIATLNLELRKLRFQVFSDQPVILTYANAKNYPEALKFDSMSIKQLFDEYLAAKVDRDLLRLLEIQVSQVFGADPAKISALQFMATIGAEGTSLISSQKTFKFTNGFSELVESLAFRIQGVLPDYSVKLQRSLREIRRTVGAYELVFNTADGVETYTAKNIISTIPFNKLKDVRGLKEVGFSDQKISLLNSLDYGNHLKGYQLFDRAFWRKNYGGQVASVGNFSGDLHFPSIWDGGRVTEDEIIKAVLTFERGGEIPPMVLENMENYFGRDLARFYSDVPGRVKGSMQFINWASLKHIGGSKAYYKPGSYLNNFGRAREGELEGSLQFAGEHTSLLNPGTVEGAVETALAAARAIKV